MQTSNTTDSFIYALALKSIKGLGNRSIAKLYNHFNSFSHVFEANAAQLASVDISSTIIRQIHTFDFSSLEYIYDWLGKPYTHVLAIDNPLYPPQLKEIYDPPAVIFAVGDISLLTKPQIAIVGTRNPSPQGLHNTAMFSQQICEHGLAVTSGLAAGVDGEAHRAAISCKGHTIAVAGTGLNRVYPAKHRELAHQIARKGLIISENFPDDPIHHGSFPQRNRIIAGLSLAVLVVEAAAKSGSLITAQSAIDEGREVFALPGSIHSPLSKGCHKLIKQGAKLVESIDDILEGLTIVAKRQIDNNKQSIALEPTMQALLDTIDYEVTPLDTIVSRNQSSVDQVVNHLLQLELDGYIINSSGGYIRQSS
ncbi:MAG: DNA-processing protein DprA [Gammaproteobacteria bacterium]|nr:DNA-processing protein DprA [Gammaproteobacteria bacterium]